MAKTKAAHGKGYGGPAMGAGWGGPAKGPGNGALITLDGLKRGQAVAQAMTPDERDRRYLHSAECRDEMRQILVDIARTGDSDGVRAMAADKMHTLAEKSIAATGPEKPKRDFSRLTDAELETALALMKKAAGEAD